MARWHLDDDEEEAVRGRRDPRDEAYGRREASGAYDDLEGYADSGDAQEMEDVEDGRYLPRRGPGAPEGGRLLSFYDSLRQGVLRWAEERGRASRGATRALLLVPDVFILLVRLTLDREVPKPARALIGGALAYFILPLDFLPEMVLGPIGFMDDLVLAVTALGQAFGDDLEPFTRKHWSGPEELRVVLRDVSTSADQLLGNRLYARLRRYLGRRGVELGRDR